PRPVGWISTLSAQGVANLAPYSFFNAFSDDPFYVAFGSGGYKHTLRNVTDTREFAFNLATYDLREAMNVSSTGADVDEFVAAGLEKGACRLIKAPRVLASPVTLECKHFKTVELPGADGEAHDWLVIGKVVGVHIDDQFIENGRVNTAAMRPIARLGYSEYATVDMVWRMRRPD
ncbi:MAG: flavin reductase family protein, partial [Alphaproteobacteria bacterium]|nr:flavin reductase family protein [Alphaproteobacteria bacterium]